MYLGKKKSGTSRELNPRLSEYQSDTLTTKPVGPPVQRSGRQAALPECITLLSEFLYTVNTSQKLTS